MRIFHLSRYATIVFVLTQNAQSAHLSSMSERKVVFFAANRAHCTADRIANARVPMRVDETRESVLRRNGAIFENEYEQRTAPILKRYNLERWEFEAIISEGVSRRWPGFSKAKQCTSEAQGLPGGPEYKTAPAGEKPE